LSGRINQLTTENTRPLDGHISLAYADNLLRIETLRLSDNNVPKVSITGYAPLAFKNNSFEPVAGELQLNGDFDLGESPFIEWLLRENFENVGKINGDFRVRGSWQEPVGDFNFNGKNLLLKNSNWLPPEQFTADLALKALPDKIVINNAAIAGKTFSLQVKGTAANNFKPATLLQPHGIAALRKTKIDLAGSFKLDNLAWLAEHQEILRRSAGNLAGEFQAAGTLAEPHLQASFMLQKGDLQLNNEIPSLQDISLSSKLQDNLLTLEHFSANLGGAPISCRGTVELPFKGKKLSFDLDLSGKNLLIYRAEGLKFRGNAEIKAHGTYEKPQLSGSIFLTDSKVYKNIDFLSSLLSSFSPSEKPPPRFPSFSQPPLRDTSFNLKIEALNPVLVSNSLFKGSLTPALQLRGTGEVPFLTGKLYIDNGKLMLPTGRVSLDSGLVQFLERSPDQPEIELLGSAKMRGYDISLSVSGPYNSPVITLSSTPALPNEELLMLLLTGKLPESAGDQASGFQSYSNVAVYFGRNLIKSIFSDEESEPDESLLDRLQLQIGRNITQKGEETMEAEFLLAEDIYNGDNAILLTGEKDVWDKYNAGLRLVFKFK
jgi:autotransporter translocation and assembly factor TamB